MHTADLVDLLRPTRKRLKWVTLSACLSAAATADETLRWMGLDPARLRQPEDAAGDDADAADDTAKRLPVLARTVAEELNCGVLAMRFPVGDEFAIELAQRVYGGVFESGQPLHQALRYAMAELCGPPQTAAPRRHSPLAIATPTLFGQALLSLSLSPRQAHPEPDAGDTPLALFPPPHERLVGRVRELTRASRCWHWTPITKACCFTAWRAAARRPVRWKWPGNRKTWAGFSGSSGSRPRTPARRSPPR